MPDHRKLLHDGSFWTVVGILIAIGLFFGLSQAPSEVGGLPLIPSTSETTATTPIIGTVALATGAVVTLGAHQHLEQDGMLHDDFEPGAIVQFEAELMADLRWAITESFYRLQIASIEESIGIAINAIIHAFSQLAAAIVESVTERSLSSFSKRLTPKDVAIIILTFLVFVLLIYSAYGIIKKIRSRFDGNSEAMSPVSIDETIATLEGTNGTLKSTYESITIDRRQWESRYHGDHFLTIPLEDVQEFNTSAPGLITDGYVHLQTLESKEPKANITAYRNQTTVKCDTQVEAEAWVRQTEQIRTWKRNLSQSDTPLSYLAA